MNTQKKGHLLIISHTKNTSQAAIYDYKGTCISFADHALGHSDTAHNADPHELIYTLRASITKALQKIQKKIKIDGIGIWTNTPAIYIWEADTYTPISTQSPSLNTYKAVQDLKKSKLDEYIFNSTGQRLTKDLPISILKAHTAPLNGKTRPKWKIGPLETWWLYHLTAQKSFESSFSTALSTGLFNLLETNWDKLLTQECHISPSQLPKVKADLSQFGLTKGFFPLDDNIPIIALTTSLNAMHEAIRKTSSQSGIIHLDTVATTLIQSPEFTLNERIAVPTKTTLQIAEKYCHIIPAPLPQWIQTKPLQTQNHSLSIIPIEGKSSVFFVHPPKLAIIGLTDTTTPEEITTAYLLSIGYDISHKLITQFPKLGLKEIAITGPIAEHPLIRQTLSDLLQIPVMYFDSDLENIGLARLILASHFQTNLPAPKPSHTVIPQMDPISRYANINKWDTLKKALSS
jgi:glycerol kinase